MLLRYTKMDCMLQITMSKGGGWSVLIKWVRLERNSEVRVDYKLNSAQRSLTRIGFVPLQSNHSVKYRHGVTATLRPIVEKPVSML